MQVDVFQLICSCSKIWNKNQNVVLNISHLQEVQGASQCFCCVCVLVSVVVVLLCVCVCVCVCVHVCSLLVHACIILQQCELECNITNNHSYL